MALITEAFIERFNLGTRNEVLIRDQRLTGFTLRVRRRSDGTLARTFFVVEELSSKSGPRKRRKTTIGEWPTFTAEAARAEAQGMLQAIEKGDDPKRARRERRDAKTIAELAELFDTEHVSTKKAGTQSDYRGRVKRQIVPEFGTMKVSDLTQADVSSWHRRRSKLHPTDANRSLAILSKMMSFAIGQGLRRDNPCRGIERNKERSRDQWLDEHDLPAFRSALAKVDSSFGELIRFLAVTGWRVNEARKLQWKDVDLKRRIATLPDSKTGRAVRALSTDAITVIERQVHRTGYVFSKRRGSYALDYRHTLEVLRAICVEAEIVPITPHVLRHTAATWAANDGASAHEIREAFGWKTLAMTQRYVSRAESLARKGVQRAADAMNVLGK